MRQFPYNSIVLGLLLLPLLAFLFASPSLAVSKSRGKKKAQKEEPVDICDIDKSPGEAPIFCYCNADRSQNATEANCWVLSRFEPTDPTWGYFTSQSHLEKLTFTVRQINSLDFVPTDLLRRMKNLRSIGFQYARLLEIFERTFSNFSDITDINLSRNTIGALHKHAFENMRSLAVINLDDNRISEINRDTFVGLPSLRKLYLNRNNISTVHDKAFKLLGSLQELELSGNQITVITRDSFHGLRDLLRLDLRGNQITMLGDRSFVEMPELAELQLDQNQIKYISDRAFDGMDNLRKLQLSENQLVSLQPHFLAGASKIYFLDLRMNALRTVTFDNVKPIMRNLYDSNGYLYLSRNNLICDCKLAWIWGLRNETKNPKLQGALEELTCFLESNNASRKINSEDPGRNQPHEMREEYYDNSRDGDNNEDDVDDNNGDYYDDSDDENSLSNSHSKTDYRRCCRKHLFDLKPDDLPCPELSREDLMASEQPSSRHENARVGSSGSSWFSSGTTSVQAGQSVLLASFLLLSIPFFT
ncbi:hypothetical protein P5V15_011563 [Pogonomyrmex californicus]